MQYKLSWYLYQNYYYPYYMRIGCIAEISSDKSQSRHTSKGIATDEAEDTKTRWVRIWCRPNRTPSRMVENEGFGRIAKERWKLMKRVGLTMPKGPNQVHIREAVFDRRVPEKRWKIKIIPKIPHFPSCSCFPSKNSQSALDFHCFPITSNLINLIKVST